ncbi:hypothetical protein ACLQ24_13120 [Micromonospora sp. DT4]
MGDDSGPPRQGGMAVSPGRSGTVRPWALLCTYAGGVAREELSEPT